MKNKHLKIFFLILIFGISLFGSGFEKWLESFLGILLIGFIAIIWQYLNKLYKKFTYPKLENEDDKTNFLKLKGKELIELKKINPIDVYVKHPSSIDKPWVISALIKKGSFPFSEEKEIIIFRILDKDLETLMKVGLNDRIAFVKKIFHNRDDDFNRVLSQINGFDKYEEAESIKKGANNE